MAGDKKMAASSTNDLFLKLGLDLSDLETGFISAEQTVKENVARLNRENNKVRLQMDTELLNLEGVGNELDKIKVKHEAISKQLDIQRQKAILLNATYQDVLKNKGADSGVTKNAETALLQQQKIIAQLEVELRKLEEAKAEAEKTIQLNVEGEEAKKTLSGIVSEIEKLKSLSVGDALTAVQESLKEIPTLGKAIGVISEIPAALKAVESSLLEIAKPAIAAGDAFYVMSRGMQMSIKDAAQLSTICKVTGIDINEVNSAMRRLNMQIVNADDKETGLIKTLKEYGVEVRNANGELKNYLDMSIAIADGLKKAQEVGKGKDYIASVLGRSASGDIVTYLEDLNDNIEQAKKVVKNKLSDPARAHAIQGEINTMEAQAAQLNSAFSSVFIPIAEKIVPQTTERLGELTKVIADNAEGIKAVGEEVAKVVNSVETVATEATTGVANAVGELGKSIDVLKAAGLEDYLKQGATAGMILGGMVGGAYGGVKGATGGSTLGYGIGEGIYALVGENYLKFTGEWDYYQQKATLINQEKKAFENLAKIKSDLAKQEVAEHQEANEIQQKLEIEIALATNQRLKEKLENIRETTEKSIEAGKEEAAAWKKAEKEIAKAIEEARAEAEKANEELKQSIYELTHNDLQNKFDKVDLKSEEMLNRGADSDLVNQAAKLQRKKIQEDFEREVLSKVNESYQTDLQNRLQAIEQEKVALQQKGLEEIQAKRWAESEKAKVIRDFNNEVVQNLDSIWNTELQNRLNRIEQEKQAWIDKGISEVESTRWAEQAKADAQKNAAMNVLKSQYEEYKAYQQGGYKGLQEYKYNQLEKAGIDPKDLYMTPAQLQEFQQAKKAAENSLLPNFMTEQDKIANATQWGGYAQRELANYVGSEEGYERMKNYVENFNPYDKNSHDRLADPRWAKYEGEAPIYYQPEQNLLGNITPYSENQAMIDQMLNNSAEFDALKQQPIDNGILLELSTKLSDLTTAITDIQLSQPEQNYSDRNISQQQPLTVNPTVQINEAHAWDSEHIEELADKVADKIESAITNAIGGDSNSY